MSAVHVHTCNYISFLSHKIEMSAASIKFKTLLKFHLYDTSSNCAIPIPQFYAVCSIMFYTQRISAIERII